MSCGAAPGSYAARIVSDGPWGYWRLNEAAGSTAYDCSGNGQNAAYVGGVTLAAVSRNTAAAYFPAATVAPLFDGYTGFVILPSFPSSAGGGPFAVSYSIEFWAQYATFPFPGSLSKTASYQAFVYSFADAGESNNINGHFIAVLHSRNDFLGLSNLAPWPSLSPTSAAALGGALPPLKIF